MRILNNEYDTHKKNIKYTKEKCLKRIFAKEFEQYKEKNPEYIDFEENGVSLLFVDSSKSRKINYKNIDKLELVIDTCICNGYLYGGDMPVNFSAHNGVYINITSGSNTYSIHHNPINLNVLYEIIRYSQYVKTFSYSFTGDGEKTKKTLKKVIDDYIKNGYKKTLLTHMNSPINPLVLVLIFLILFGGFMLFISSLFHHV